MSRFLIVLLACVVAACSDASEARSANAAGEEGTASGARDETTASRPSPTDWPSARGDDHNSGISRGGSDATRGEVRWTWDAAGRLWQMPVARDGVLYVGDGSLNFQAIRVRDGKVLWTRRPRTIKLQDESVPDEGTDVTAAAEPNDLDDHYGYSIPVIDGDQVITITAYGVMTAFARADGAIRWEHDFGGKVFGSPRIKGDRLLVTSLDGRLQAFDKNTGEPDWAYETAQPMLGSSVAFLDDRTAVLPGHDRFIHVVDITTGQAIERHEIAGRSASSPLVAFGCVYLCRAGQRFVCFDLVTREVRWEREGRFGASNSFALQGPNVLVHVGRELRAYHGVTGAVSWKTTLEGTGDIAPCVGPRLVYMADDLAWAYAIDPANGKIVWKRRFGSANRGHPLLVDGLLIVGNLKGRMTAFE